MKGMKKKAEMGIGTLIIFIALLLVAAVAAGVLIQTAGSLQERALTTGDQAKGQIATNVKVVEVSATDGGDGDLENVEMIMKLSPGSNAIKLEQTLLTANVFDRTASLTYRGTSGTYEDNVSDGFYTLAEETVSVAFNSTTNGTLSEDYDLDGVYDIIGVETTSVVVYFTDDSSSVTLTGLTCDGSDQTGSYTVSGNDFVESFTVVGNCTGADTGNLTLTLTPKKIGDGFFTVEYLQRGTNPVAGNLQTGDVIRVYFEAPRDIGEDEEVRMNFIPKIGTPTLTQFITPEVISIERVYLYP